MKYIDVDLALTAFYECDADVMADYGPEYGAEWGFSRAAIENVLSSVPTADVRPVVYCKDCKYYGQKSLNPDFPVIDEWCSKLGFAVPSLFYCAYGERRAEEHPPELTEK